MDRRTTIKKIVWGSTLPFFGGALLAQGVTPHGQATGQKIKRPLHLFTKVLQWVPLEDLPSTVKDMGFAGIDIAVRSNGHFTVSELREKLPPLVASCTRLGMGAPILTTELTGEKGQEMAEFLKIISGEGVKHYRMGWLKYKSQDVMEELRQHNSQLERLADLHQKYGVQGHYQNHAGNGVGGSVWELLYLLEGIDPKAIGIQYDLRHAMVEGYRSWENGFHVIKDKITSLDIKDFRWNDSSGKDVPVTVPLGRGNVDFSKITSSAAFKSSEVPKILHVEYNLGGAEHGKKDPAVPAKDILSAIRKDVEYFEAHFQS